MAKSGKNRLREEVSPYLLQHADNPVHWWSWGPEALAAAGREGKPILLSIGYAACHWCHVMAHESFEDASTAKLMNRLFINIKVDREERPDLDAIYQRALGLLGTQGGWPLTMFLDAGGAPFWGGTYFPNQPRYGRADFKTVLRQVSGIYHTNPAAVKKNRAVLLRGLQEIGKTGAPEEITEAGFLSAAKLMLSQMDSEYGGISGAPKFPNVPLLELLWRVGIRTGEASYRDAVIRTLTRICQGGIYDHLGGGVARYSTDPYWLVPHFEKMLYDNALFIGLLTEVWKETRNPLFEARVRETIAWLFEEMMTPGGAFASAIDADSEGEEGAFYVWSKEEIDRILEKDAPRFNKYYGVRGDGNWEGKTILNRLHDPDHFDAAEDATLFPLRNKLLAARGARPRPLRDDKVLADWNGLMIRALTNAGQTFGQPAWVDAARTAFDFISSKMCRKGLLHHSFRAKRLGAAAFLDDYATMISASIGLYSLSEDEICLSKAKIWTSDAEKWLSGPDFNGFFTTSSQNTDLIARPRSNFDQVTPAGNSLMIRNYTALYRLTGDQDYRDKADKLLKVFAGTARTAPMACPGFFSAFDTVLHGAHLLIKDRAASPRTRAFLDVVAATSFPGLVVRIAPGAKGLKTGEALLCRGAVCSLPLTRPAMLKEELIRLRQNQT